MIWLAAGGAWTALSIVAGMLIGPVFRRRADPIEALADATREPRRVTLTADDMPAPTSLHCHELDRINAMSDWIRSHHARDTITGNGAAVSDYLRSSVPDLDDATIGRVLFALVQVAGRFRGDDYRAFIAFADAIGAACVDLTYLERQP